MERRYLNIAWLLTAILAICAIIAENVDSIPSWTIAIPAVLTGFWWAFGRGALGDGSPKDEGPSV
ncbi:MULTISPECIES: hypothetical protein [unclassified Knoellia]|uniref:hypothetical protein n=1 Tax=Knoellia altitudinis TaxID=3404795 RepID=UPI0036240E6A